MLSFFITTILVGKESKNKIERDMNLSKILILLFAFALTQCDKNEVDPEVCTDSENKDWYANLINQYNTTPMDNWGVPPKVKIYSYTYNGQKVIAVNIIEPTCCDMMDVVYDCSGNVICQFGGIAGLNTCPDFADTAIDKKLIFKN